MTTKPPPLTCPCCGSQFAQVVTVKGAKWRRSAGFDCDCEIVGRCLRCGRCKAHCADDDGPVRDPRKLNIGGYRCQQELNGQTRRGIR